MATAKQKKKGTGTAGDRSKLTTLKQEARRTHTLLLQTLSSFVAATIYGGKDNFPDYGQFWSRKKEVLAQLNDFIIWLYTITEQIYSLTGSPQKKSSMTKSPQKKKKKLYPIKLTI